jgi:PAS domain S-box-containing protein
VNEQVRRASKASALRGRVQIGLLVSGLMSLAFLIVAVLTVFAVTRYMRQQALTEAEAKARIIADSHLATHHYFTNELKPDVLSLAVRARSGDHFDPIWMSSTYAVREIDKAFQAQSPTDYYYKDAAINARSPANEANVYERAFLEQLNRQPSLNTDSGVHTIAGQPYFVLMRRGETMDAGCLQCHGKPADAPADLVTTYGPQRSFGRQVGETVSAISVRVPLAAAYAGADRFARQLSALLLVLLAGLLFLGAWVYRTLVIAPLALIGAKARQIVQDEACLGESLPTPVGRELAELTDAFNRLSIGLWSERDCLEQNVALRTAQLERAGAELSETNDRLREQAALLDLTHDAIMVCDMGGVVRYWNRGAERMYGWTAEQAVGEQAGVLLHTRFPAPSAQIYGEVRACGRWEGDLIHACRDGREITVASRWALLRDGTGAPKATLEINSDITAQRLAQQELRASEERLRIQVQQMPVACILWDTEMRAQSWNPAAERIFGFSAAEAIGRDARDLIVPTQVSPAFQAVRARLLSGDDAAQSINRNVTKDGRIIVCEWTNMPIRDKDNRLLGVLSMAQDITDRKKLETALREERERMARELHDSVTQSLYSLTLFGDAGRQEAARGNVTQAAYYLGRISETSVQALKEMRLLVYQLRPAVLEDQGIVGALEYRLSAVERRAGVKAKLIADEGLSLPMHIAEGLYRIAQEALNNILKHAEATQVTARLERQHEAVALTIEDNGLGFDPAAVSQGGLGLISMRERASGLGGTVTVRSAPGQGTTVTAVIALTDGAGLVGKKGKEQHE